VATYETEDQQVEELKKWWKENGKSVITGVVIGFALLAGWRWWQTYTEQQAQIASSIYEQVLFSLEKEEKPEKANEIAGKLLSNHSGSPYAVLAVFNLARHDLENGDIDSAHARLQWAIDQNSHLSELTHIARLRKTRLFLSQEKWAEAKSLITGIEVAQFKGAYAELRGDIAVAEGQIDEARTAYEEALETEDLSFQHREWVQMKRDNLGLEPDKRIETNSPFFSEPGNPSTAPDNPLAITEPAPATPSTTPKNDLTIIEPAPATPSTTLEKSLTITD
jgi:predicted negative regulator of RcsB-dependent stress response